ncbi:MULTISPECIES: hypothetical protein [unclassified Mesorhizobium]|uniref:hypothetical protein n=1 Tax=unclassified Mesorhizobium TaxID=325217 RepID=UPI001928DD16|nr:MULTISPECIES: hypothetical protein [unclassified Mesorhizobium]
MPIQAYDLLGSERQVSLLYAVISVMALIGTLFVPSMIDRVARKWGLYHWRRSLIGAVAMCTSTNQRWVEFVSEVLAAGSVF